MALTPVCTEGTTPEFSADLELNECLLLSHRIVWRGSIRPPLIIEQTFEAERLGVQSTGSAVWSGGLALARFMEGLGQD